MCRKLFSRLETDRLARRNRNLFAGPGITAHTSFPGLHDEHTESAKLNSLTLCKCVLHCIEQRIDNLFGLLLWNAGLFCHLVDDIQFDHHYLLC